MRSETCSTSTPASACTAATICCEVVGARRVDGDVAHLLALLDADEVDRPEAAAGVADRTRDVGERAGTVVEVDAKRGAERRGGMRIAHGEHRRRFGQAQNPASVAGVPITTNGARPGRNQRSSRSSSTEGSATQPAVGEPVATWMKIAEPAPGTIGPVL